jgi:flavorubredoxin
LLLVSACSTPAPREIQISAQPVDKPELVLPKVDKIQTRSVEWYLITPQNAQEVFETISKSGKSVVLFGITDQGYENLALNLSDIRALIQQQQAIIVAYEGYYKDSNSALEAANKEITNAAEQAKTAVDNSQPRGLSRFNIFN